jgi:hypothetical protein
MEASSIILAGNVPAKVEYVLGKICTSKFLPELKPEIEFNFLAVEKLAMEADRPAMFMLK